MTDLRTAIMEEAEKLTRDIDEVSQPEGEAPAEEQASPEVDESGEPAAEEPQPSAEAEQALTPPQHWEAADKEAFAGLPRQAQEYLLKRDKAIEATITRKTQEVAEQRKAVEPLLGAVKQHESYLKSIGASPDVAFAALIGAERTLRTGSPEQKANALAKLISDYAIDTSLIGAAPQPQNQTMQTYEPVYQELQSLRQQVNGMTESQIMAQVKSFEEAKTPDGQPMYPHFNEVRADMGRLLDAYPEKGLPELYAMAVRANEEVWNKAQAERELKARQAQTEEARKAAAQARKAGSVNIKPHSISSGSENVLSLRESIKQEAMRLRS